MGLFGRFRRGGGRAASGRAVPGRAERRADLEAVRRHLHEFVNTRRGVEAFLEPPTTMIPPTVLLVAGTGEWTRRRVADPALVRGLAEELRVPVYDVRLVGYPQRMRDWNARAKAAGTTPGDAAGPATPSAAELAALFAEEEGPSGRSQH